jgi:general secretion pathway protein B
MTQALPEPPASMPPPMLRPAGPPQTGGTRNSLADEMSGGVPPMELEAAVAAAAPPAGPAAVTPAKRGSVVYQSLPEAEPSTAYSSPQASTSDLPRADDMTARGALPELRLELHVWSTKPQERFVFVNGRRYREGDATAEGATVEEITREGVILNSGGNRFLLSRD